MPLQTKASLKDNRVKIFIICADEDIAIAERIHNDLGNHGLCPWLTNKDIKAGQNIECMFRSEIKKSDYIICLLSRYSLTQKGISQKQLKKALDIYQEIPTGKIFLIPAQLDDTEPQQDILQGLKSADFRSSYEKGFKQIIQAIELDKKFDKIEPKNENIIHPISIKANQEERSVNKQEQDHMELPFKRKTELIGALLNCATMSNLNSRLAVINNLRKDIKNRINTGNNALIDIENIVTICNDFENGIVELIDIIRHFEGNSIPIQNLEKLIKHLGIQ